MERKFGYLVNNIESENHLLKKLSKILKANLIVMTGTTYEIVVKAPRGYVWVDNGLEELSDSQWDGDSKQMVNKNVLERMQKGLKKP